ncbi:MAG: PKD domain-containing protein [Bacteroidota bacterium]|nr:PKD domain-containing protein [Bacteroidota bacterium]
MNKVLRVCAFSLLFLLSFTGAKATHIVGGEIFYDCLGGNVYRITLKVYRDCINGQAPYDAPAYVGIFNMNGTLLDTIPMTFPGSINVPPTINTPCYSPPTGVCVEEAVYQEIVTLPPIPVGGLYLAYQRCCRNNSILNLVNPGGVGSTYQIIIPHPSQAICNNSPRYNNFPPIYICQGAPLIFDHSAAEPDGDSLAYELCDPFDGANATLPQPIPPAGPPYQFVPFAAPYSGTYPMSSNPAMAIDPVTGLLTGTPNLSGQWVVGVCCKEYRNGVLICVNKRDFQFNVTPCPLLTISSIPTQTVFCAGFTVQFLNNSFNATTYHWDFGDPNTNADTSNLFTPTYTYADTGTYTVTLYCNPGSACADTNTSTFQIYPPVVPAFVSPQGQCFIGNSFNFQATGQFIGNGTTTWNFGANANPSTSNVQDPQNIVYNAPGVYPVTITVTENGCTGTFTDSVIVYPTPTSNFSATPLYGCVPYTVEFQDSSIAGTPMTYQWDFGDGFTSTLPNPTHTYTDTGSYDVTLIITTTNGCIGIDTFSVLGMINVFPSPTAGFDVTAHSVSIFSPFIGTIDLSQNADSCVMDFGDGFVTGNCNAVHTYWNYGSFMITQTVYNEFGCPDTAQILIEVIPEHRFFIPNTFTPNGDGLNDMFIPVLMGVEDYHFMLFDRWGNLMFETIDTYQGWDGRYKGNRCQEDVYVWKITCTNVVNGEEIKIIGHVNLVR